MVWNVPRCGEEQTSKRKNGQDENWGSEDPRGVGIGLGAILLGGKGKARTEGGGKWSNYKKCFETEGKKIP